MCRRYQIAPGQFYQWEKQAREGALQALRNGKRGRKKAGPTVQLQAEVERLRAVVAELSAENLQLKRGSGHRQATLLSRGEGVDPEDCVVALKLEPDPGSHTVTLAVQQALERLDGCHPGEPRLVHDHGSQFLSFEWRSFISSVGLMEIRTRLAHPESYGRLERLHRTHREEELIGEGLKDYYQAVDVMKRWSWYYNYKRSHSALGYMPPAEYYRDDPKARWAERHQKLAQATGESLPEDTCPREVGPLTKLKSRFVSMRSEEDSFVYIACGKGPRRGRKEVGTCVFGWSP